MLREIEFKKSDSIKVIAETASFIDSLEDDKQYVMTIKEKKNKRSLNANAYAWVLLDKLAVKLGIAKTELYRSYIKEIGGNSDIVCCVDKAVKDLCEGWQGRGLGWLTDLTPSKIEGCTNVILYYGSSTYDSKQMSRLINLIVQDCIENDIPTLEDMEIERLCREWEV